MNQEQLLKTRLDENKQLGITKGYVDNYAYDWEQNKTKINYFAICGYSNNVYGETVKHVNKCMECKRHLGISKSAIKSRSEIVDYFLLDKEINNYSKDAYRNYVISNNAIRSVSDDFNVLASYGNIIALKRNNIIYRNYERIEMIGSMFGSHNNALSEWDYIRKADRLGLFDLKICDLPLDTLTRIQQDSKIIEINVIEPTQDQYIFSAGHYNKDKDEYYSKVVKKEKDQYMDDKFFKVLYRNINNGKIIQRSFIWQFDETAKCLIEVSNLCENHQQALLFLYPENIKNRSGTLRQGEFFFEPSTVKITPLKHQFEQEKRIKDKKDEISNHYATHRHVTSFKCDSYEFNQYVQGTIRHVNKDHRMLKLKKGIWYKVHQSNAINAYSIDLRQGMKGD